MAREWRPIARRMKSRIRSKLTVLLSSYRNKDTPELAELIRQGIRSRHTPHRKGDVRKLLERVRQRSQA